MLALFCILYKMKNILVSLLFLLICLSVDANRTLITTASAINNGSWAAGDTIVWQNGSYTNQTVTLKTNGSASQPVVLMAQTPGQVLMSGTSHFLISGSYIEVSGFFFKNGNLSGTEIFSFRTSSSEFANNCRLTNCAILNCNPTDNTVDSKWVSLYGKNNRVDHCSFQNKTNMGTLLVVWLTMGTVPSHIIDNNYFGYRNSNVDATGAELNGQETIRVGDSGTSMQVANVQIINNFFEHCNGEIEIISNKSCNNYISNNVFYECVGMLTLRHGNGTTVDGNYFFGNNLSSTGGVRIIGENHKVYNNYFEKLGGSGNRAALTMMVGKLNSLANEYFQVKNALVVFNTMVDCNEAFAINYGTSTYTQPPITSVIAHNNVYNTSSSNSAVNVYLINPALDITWNNNLINQGKYTNFGYSGTQIIPGKDPKMTLAGTSINMYEPGSASALLSYTTTDYPEIAVDIRGRNRGTTAKLPGASQTTVTTTRVMPNRTTSGASFFNGSLTDIKNLLQNVGFKCFVADHKLTTCSTYSGKLSVHDTVGKTIFYQQISSGISSNILPLKNGIYILNFMSFNGSRYSEKIIIH